MLNYFYNIILLWAPVFDIFPLQFYEAQLDILMVLIVMPLSDLPFLGRVVVLSYGLVTACVLIPYNFLDTFLLSFEQVNKDEDQMWVQMQYRKTCLWRPYFRSLPFAKWTMESVERSGCGKPIRMQKSPPIENSIDLQVSSTVGCLSNKVTWKYCTPLPIQPDMLLIFELYSCRKVGGVTAGRWVESLALPQHHMLRSCYFVGSVPAVSTIYMGVGYLWARVCIGGFKFASNSPPPPPLFFLVLCLLSSWRTMCFKALSFSSPV